MLKRVSIQNFKSLKDVTLDLQKVNLLIGPNNSGKSNFLKALNFCGSIKEDYVLSDDLLHNKSRYSQLRMSMVFDNTYPFIEEKYNHFLIQSNPKNNNLFASEKGLFIGEVMSDELEQNIEASDISEINKNFTEVILSNLNDYLGDVIIYKPEPSKIMLPGAVGLGEEFVNESASNLVGFLDLILGKYRRSTFHEIENYLKLCLPEFTEINLEDTSTPRNIDKDLQNRSFKRIGLSGIKRNTTYWANELSEGTLYFLALLCIINQPNPPNLLLIEEPEKGIHPRRIWEIMKFIFQLAEKKSIQIILTTHNEHVVNAFASIPEAVFVFDKDEEGATHVRNLQRDIIDVSNKKSAENGFDPIDFTSDLGKSWLYGLIGGVPEETI